MLFIFSLKPKIIEKNNISFFKQTQNIGKQLPITILFIVEKWKIFGNQNKLPQTIEEIEIYASKGFDYHFEKFPQNIKSLSFEFYAKDQIVLKGLFPLLKHIKLRKRFRSDFCLFEDLPDSIEHIKLVGMHKYDNVLPKKLPKCLKLIEIGMCKNQSKQDVIGNQYQLIDEYLYKDGIDLKIKVKFIVKCTYF